MSNHKTRDFMTSLDEAETWITPGWCSPYVPMFQPYRGDLAEALADIDTAALAYRDIIAEQYAKFGRATNNLIRPDPKSANQNRPDPV